MIKGYKIITLCGSTKGKKELQQEFPGIKGFSTANLWRMKNFYINYCENEKLAPLVREISWTKNVVILEI